MAGGQVAPAASATWPFAAPRNLGRSGGRTSGYANASPHPSRPRIAALLLPASASAKDFRPGDVKLCDEQTCVVIGSRQVLDSLADFYFGGPAPAEVRPPKLGAPYLQLRFGNGYVTGIAATAQLDRFRSGGVNMGQFGVDSWYRVPAKLARALRKLAQPLHPRRVTRSTLGRSRYG